MYDTAQQRLSAENIILKKCIVSRCIIDKTILELRVRSAGRRESAAIWSGKKDGQVESVHFHHELGDDKAGPLSLELPEKAKYQLYKDLAKRGESLIALLHTHPEDWVGLSWIDQQNQISSSNGFWSIVIPHYGVNEWNNSDIGFHVRTDTNWCELTPNDVQSHFKIID